MTDVVGRTGLARLFRVSVRHPEAFADFLYWAADSTDQHSIFKTAYRDCSTTKTTGLATDLVAKPGALSVV